MASGLIVYIGSVLTTETKESTYADIVSGAITYIASVLHAISADLQGSVAYSPNAQGTGDWYYLTDDLNTYSGNGWPPGCSSIGLDQVQATLTNNVPVDSTTFSITGGHKAQSYLDDYYFRIHIRPNPIALGNLLSAQQRDVEVWNAWIDAARTLSTINESLTDGLVLNRPIVEPTVFQTNESRIYTLNIAVNGPPRIDASYSFVFDTGAAELRVTGQRVVPFAIKPDWSQTIRDSFEWLTEILTSYAGGEQRRKLREYPRRILQYRIILQGDEQQRGNILLAAWQSRNFAIPLWFDVTRLSSGVTSNQSAIACDTRHRGFYIGGLGIIRQSAFVYEAFEIADMSDSSITVASPLTQDWPANTPVYPLRLGMLDATQKGKLEHAGLSVYDMQFLCDDTDNAYEAIDYTTLYRGLPVLTTPNNVARDVSMEWARQLEIIDFNINGRYVDDQSNRAAIAFDYNFLAATLADRHALIQALFARAGKFNACWLASGQSDFTVMQAIGAGNNGITVAYTGYSLYLSDLPNNRRDLVIKTKAGTVYYRRIISATDNGDGTEALVLDSALGADVAVSQIKILSFLTYMRLASDTVTLEHETASIAQCAATFVSVLDDV
ncbi:MAG: hypothetical protein M8364_16595 [Methylobacter sp.]|uniref:hypothetical protein n=1 Tax=Methylobacter sp. TaxID=2051955 RepID=UPI00258F7918|nr:hypothetical protein [Methylobacter sp.]MCL7422511.1 hypothetical protein [Methylobacter sp.]